MKIIEIITLQAHLDEVIAENIKDTGYDMNSHYAYDHQVFAFHCEVMELANEIKFFKYWKKDKKLNMAKVLDEGVDCIHFLLSIGLKKKYHNSIKDIEPFMLWEDYEMEDMFKELRRNDIDTVGRWKLAFELILGIMLKAGLNEIDIIRGYYRKNEVNLQRQEDGY